MRHSPRIHKHNGQPAGGVFDGHAPPGRLHGSLWPRGRDSPDGGEPLTLSWDTGHPYQTAP